MNPPTKPTLQTCAELIASARRNLNRARKNADEDEFDAARTAFIRAHESAKRYGYATWEINMALSSLASLSANVIISEPPSSPNQPKS